MKIAIDIRAAGGERAGKGWYTFNLVRNLLLLDRKNHYLLYTKERIAGFNEFKNAEVRQISGAHLFWHHRVAKDIKKENVNIFFAPSSYIIPALLPKDVKTVITVHDLVAFLFPNHHDKKAVLMEKLFLKRALRKAAHVCPVSENTKNDLIKKFAFPENEITVIPCAVSDDFKPLKKESLKTFIKQTNLPEKFFLAVGTIEPRKNYPNLIKAFAQISEVFPDYHLIIVGKNGWQSEATHKAIQDNYLKHKIHILGYLSNSSLVKLYNLAKALVFPSLYEGFGLPPLEAMACGCPVIASNVSSIPEVIGSAGLLVDPKNYKEIAAAMASLAKDEELCEELRNRGILRARKFSWESSAKLLLELFSKL